MVKRRRGSRAPWPDGSDGRLGERARRFEGLVGDVLAGIPAPFDRALDEVAVVIEDEPTLAQLRDNGIPPHETLYGLYEGVPRTEWGADLAVVANKISLFRLPLEADFPDPADLAAEVRVT